MKRTIGVIVVVIALLAFCLVTHSLVPLWLFIGLGSLIAYIATTQRGPIYKEFD